MARAAVEGAKPLHWVGSSKRDFLAFPSSVKDAMGAALCVAQFGGKHPSAKPTKGQGPGLFEIVEDHIGNTDRAIYTVRFRDAAYVLHAFQKKSHKGIRTALSDVQLVESRLGVAQRDYEARYGESKP